ncbi:ribonuclease HI [Rubellicoccus peritrichatus]|uniref:Ribonuclease H n=1 Tax=Rubellicoccus peritrichatus TaxID=3080537 RepID=A0AAQ3QSZ0_9BACT|nr:ribonuclease HI [Puniceicoccus sp. CR14]WOO43118.1 ribonuclease HI [Puniceicoccus sp. CR14]
MFLDLGIEQIPETYQPPEGELKKVIASTDGGCDPNPGPGGWGVVLRNGQHCKTLYGSELETTNNRMELQAVLEALRALKEPCEILIRSDSKYVIDSLSDWMWKWASKGWRISKNRVPENLDLLKEYAKEVQRHRVSFEWVKGHAGDPDNELADSLAAKGVSEAGSSGR